ncbi:glucose-6-phosphate isomerase [Mycoplasmopsis phocirhinis]|uniref:Glucose-6-phosphate isomerase n=1 Tax=Mycoplasmopsis phocirhinis TaxID=142650 RepID=A0A4V0ZAJ9_9BACT|nr:glucose-6-phosphate isomerase [Mycoplasmopsis phocirhinis]QBF34962.1 glucose-6-phosphate isomerase [Mycoplasmopsis phocirhinis]
MPKLTIKPHNYYPDFTNESLVKKGVDILKEIKFKTIDGFEHFGFHELALNFGLNNTNELNEFAKNVIKHNCENIIIFSDTRTKNNFESAYNFVLRNDILFKHKIKFFFVCEDDAIQNWFSFFQYSKKNINLANTAFILSKMNKFNNKFIEFIKIFYNFVQQNFGYYKTLNNSFFVGRENAEKTIKFLNIEEKNILITPDILHHRFAFFNEINLLLMLIKGLNINEILQGYTVATLDFVSENIKNNFAFQYAYICSVIKKERKQNLLIGSSPEFIDIFALYSRMNNEKDFKNNKWTNSIIFPNDIYTYSTYSLGMNSAYFATFVKFDKFKNDYRISPELSFDDGVPKLQQNRLSQFTNISNNGIVTTLSEIINIPLVQINLAENNESVLGTFICFLYWSIIYESYLNKQNPFELN